jgi:hypothetical protein
VAAKLVKFQLLRTFGSSSFGLPVVIAWTYFFVSIGTTRHTQAFGTTFLTKEQAWLLVLCV